MAGSETDSLVVGAGADGMAFTDSPIASGDADVVIVDRRHHPGGHWKDAHSFVRFHQSSMHYGVNSRVLGTETIDTSGPNAGCYDRASGDEIAEYYRSVLDDQLLPSQRVRFLGGHDYRSGAPGENLVTSRLTGRASTIRSGAESSTGRIWRPRSRRPTHADFMGPFRDGPVFHSSS
jgi:cation diffusion facilitator CzcD-associated flavoprotein CzcO